MLFCVRHFPLRVVPGHSLSLIWNPSRVLNTGDIVTLKPSINLILPKPKQPFYLDVWNLLELGPLVDPLVGNTEVLGQSLNVEDDVITAALVAPREDGFQKFEYPLCYRLRELVRKAKFSLHGVPSPA